MTDSPICPLPHRRDPERPRRVAPGARICAGHLRGLADDIATMPTLYRTLEAYLIARGEGHGRRGDELGINLNPDVVRAREHIRNALVTWTRVVLEEGPWRHAPDDDLERMATWLIVRIDWIAARDWADDIASSIHNDVREGRGLVQPNTTYRLEIGPCPERDDQLQPCDGTVIAVMQRATSRELLPAYIACTSHGEDDELPHRWTASEWHTLGRKMGRSMHESAAQAFLRAVSGG